MTIRTEVLNDSTDDRIDAPARAGLLSVPQAADYLGVSERWVYDQIRDGKLAAMYMARAWKIRPDVLDAFADSFLARSCADVRHRGQVRALRESSRL